MQDDDFQSPVLGRREILRSAGALGLLAGLGRLSFAGSRLPFGAEEFDASDLVSSGLSQAMCVLTPSATQGPYYFDANLIRQDITEGQPGLATRLHFSVVRASDCTPIPGAAVDVWQANAPGQYSGYANQGTQGQTWLRGIQFTDANGMVSFDTIYPGWYPGRTTHVHVKVRPTVQTEITTQTYFDQPLNRRVNAWGIYAQHGQNPTTNPNDAFFLPETVMTLVGAGPLQFALTIGVA
jgi:protocatechuate 3,4-dioxygenase beta subunit